MPRHYGSSDAVRSANIRELVRSGRKPSQAVAIAIKWQDEDRKKEKK